MSLRRPRAIAHPGAAKVERDKTALQVQQASGKVKDQHQPSDQAPSHLTVHQHCLGAKYDPRANNCDDERQICVVDENGMLGGVAQRSFETIAAQRHSAASPDHQHKPRSTYNIAQEHAIVVSDLDEIFRSHEKCR